MYSDKTVGRWALLGTLAAYALLLSYIETAIALPVPGMKIGLANAIVLVALSGLGFRDAAYIAAIKIVASSLLFGSPIALLFSLVGTACSLLVMLALGKGFRLNSMIVASFGAIAHSVSQLFVASMMFHTLYVWAYTPAIVLFSVFAGAVTGGLAEVLLPCVLNEVKRSYDLDERFVSTEKIGHLVSSGGSMSTVAVFAHTAALIAFTTVAVLSPSPKVLIVSLLGLVAFAVVRGARIQGVLAVLQPLLAFSLITLLTQILFSQEGQILVDFHVIQIRDIPLLESLTFFARMVCLVGASWLFSQYVDLSSMAKAFSLVRKKGTRLELIGLSLEASVFVLPSLVEGAKVSVLDFSGGKDGGGASTVRCRLSCMSARFLRYFEKSFFQTEVLVNEYMNEYMNDRAPVSSGQRV